MPARPTMEVTRAVAEPSVETRRPLIIARRLRARDVERLARPFVPGPLTPQATAGFRRSVAGKVARHRRDWGLLAGVVEPPHLPTLEEHRDAQRAHAVSAWRKARAQWREDWLRVRARLRELPRARALELLDEWDAAATGGAHDFRAGPFELHRFLDAREPPAEVLAHRRAGRLCSAAIHREVARQMESWYIAHLTCAEGPLGIACVETLPRRVVRCIACEKAWGSQAALAAAEEAGELRIVDCRSAVQLALIP